MELTIYWTNFSEKELKKIYEYYRAKAGVRIAKKLVEGIYDETLKLKTQPKIGQIEPLLKDRRQEFRYLVFKSYKIIYWVNETQSRIEISDVFDTRQSPVEIARAK